MVFFRKNSQKPFGYLQSCIAFQNKPCLQGFSATKSWACCSLTLAMPTTRGTDSKTVSSIAFLRVNGHVISPSLWGLLWCKPLHRLFLRVNHSHQFLLGEIQVGPWQFGSGDACSRLRAPESRQRSPIEQCASRTLALIWTDSNT